MTMTTSENDLISAFENHLYKELRKMGFTQIRIYPINNVVEYFGICYHSKVYNIVVSIVVILETAEAVIEIMNRRHHIESIGKVSLADPDYINKISNLLKIGIVKAEEIARLRERFLDRIDDDF